MPGIRLTPSIKALLIACVAMFVFQQTIDQFFSGNVMGWLGLVPTGFINHMRFWQLFSYPFLHGDVMHLALNMMMLVFMGSEIEALWGRNRFLVYYFFCSTCAGFAYLFMQVIFYKGMGLYAPMVGASGAIYGLLMAYGIIFSERTLLFMMLFPMKAKHFVWILVGIEFFSSVFSGRNGLASVAHLTGMAAGFGFLMARAQMQIKRKNRVGRMLGLGGSGSKKKGTGKLKLVINNESSNSKKGSNDDDGTSGPKIWH